MHPRLRGRSGYLNLCLLAGMGYRGQLCWFQLRLGFSAQVGPVPNDVGLFLVGRTQYPVMLRAMSRLGQYGNAVSAGALPKACRPP